MPESNWNLNVLNLFMKISENSDYLISDNVYNITETYEDKPDQLVILGCLRKEAELGCLKYWQTKESSTGF